MLPEVLVPGTITIALMQCFFSEGIPTWYCYGRNRTGRLCGFHLTFCFLSVEPITNRYRLYFRNPRSSDATTVLCLYFV
ncbi:hypothetical protein Pelo_19767 [Pelomyxa schiedti]|nr:hypothetical protein Pelo_19767 [Pelomyxa schiedti]